MELSLLIPHMTQHNLAMCGSLFLGGPVYMKTFQNYRPKKVDNVLMVETDQPQTSVPGQWTHAFQV